MKLKWIQSKLIPIQAKAGILAVIKALKVSCFSALLVVLIIMTPEKPVLATTQPEEYIQESHYTVIAQQDQLLSSETTTTLPHIWPTRSRIVTSPFGYRQDPFTKKRSFHKGIDIAGTIDDPVLAAGAGTVITVDFDPFHGHHLILEHEHGLRTWYMHLNGVIVQWGEHVECGQQIGMIGTSGRSTGPHLHYEVLQDGQSMDPLPYLP